MIANYHTHTTRCHHATGEDKAYVEAAIRQGLSVIGFSDHTPQFYRGDYVNPDKMLPADMDGYVRSVLDLKQEYQTDITVLLGFETEYFPLLWDELLAAYRQYPVDYLLLGQHVVGNPSVADSFSAFFPTNDPTRLHRFINQQIAAMETGCFSYIAHPDVLHFTGDEALYEIECTRLILRAKELGIPLEINMLGLTFGRNYPNPLFWDLVGDIGAPAILGCDAHAPSRVANAKELKTAHDFADMHGVHLMDTMPLKSIVF